jgi:murein DD-endopeptidase MepM/ murein hydrolase activator NlpD
MADPQWLPRVEVLEPPKPIGRYAAPVAVVALLAGSMFAGSWWWSTRDGDPPGQPSQSVSAATPAVVTDDTQAAPTGQATLPPGMGGGTVPPTPAPNEVPADGTTPAEPPTATSTVTATPAIELPYELVNPQAGDTLITLAERYGLQVSTLLWSNEIADPSARLAVTNEIVVPDEDGVLHTVESGETLQAIAARYGVEPAAITGVAENHLDLGREPQPGTLLFVPAGRVSDRGSIAVYTVQEGDNLWTIADYYGMRPETLAWANELPRPELIHPGQVLQIPPGDGALVVAHEGETVESIAAEFGVDPMAIVNYAYNDLADFSSLLAGQSVLVPGVLIGSAAESPQELDAETVAGEGVVGPATGTFLWPTEGFLSQEFHQEHNGIDVANQEWTPVNATDGGIVIYAGWSDYGLGYTVGIDHGNGFQTWYGHLVNEPYVEVGQVIWQGGYVGGMGNTGNSNGSHLHFIVIKDGVYQNPLDYLE